MKNTRPARRLAGALAVAAIAAALGGCAAAVVGGAVATGMVATDRRSTGAQLDDQNIELRAASSLSGTFGDRAHINVTSFNAKVLITGEVATEADKQQALASAEYSSVQSFLVLYRALGGGADEARLQQTLAALDAEE